MEGRVFGYARVSSKEQNLDRQIMALREYVDEENIVVDKASGKNLERAGYVALKGRFGLREGDTLYIVSLDRLSRNKQDIKNELQWFKDRKIRLKILDLPTSMADVPENMSWVMDMVNNLIIEVLASIAQQERLTIKQRQADGIAAAKAQGKYLGRPRLTRPNEFEEYYARWKAKEITAKYAMKQLNLPSSSFYKLVKQYEEEISTKV